MNYLSLDVEGAELQVRRFLGDIQVCVMIFPTHILQGMFAEISS